VRLYFKCVQIHLKGILQYKVSFLLTVIGQFFISFTSFLGLYFLFEKFQSVKGFTYEEVLLGYAAVLMAYAVAECFAYGFKNFSMTISNGQFDRLMIRPRGTLFLVLTSQMEFSAIGRFLQAIFVLIYAIRSSNVSWNLRYAVCMLLMILGCTLVFMGLYIIYATFCFFTIEGLEFMNIFTDGGREFGKYPFSVYGEKILAIFTYLIPLACAQYYPLLYLTGKRESGWYICTTLGCVVFFCVCCGIWKIGVRNYRSTGS
jgi:ABC-2 type transport system permease protein